jgi:hypothetical protein
LLQDADNLQVRQLLHLFRVPSNNMDKWKK